MHMVDTGAALARLMRFLAVEGVTGKEARIGKDLHAAFREAGVPAKAMRFDEAHKRIPLPTESGNLIVDLPGQGRLKSADRLLFMTHMDTVPLCAGARPKQQGRKIVNTVRTALGGDNRTGCAVLVSLAAELIKQKADHPPITILITVREESGLWGARHVALEELGPVTMGFNFDGRQADAVIVGAVGADRWEVEIFGRASHAGTAPERGISATMIFAEAMSAARAGGWFGKVERNGKSGTSNIGPVGGADGRPAGDATNVVTDYVHAAGESRSHDGKFFREITAAYKAAFTKAAAEMQNAAGKAGKVKFTSRTDYYPFRMKDNAPVVQRSAAAIASLGRQPIIRTANGGLDANWLFRHGVPTTTFGAGQNEAHTVDEWIDLDEFDKACQLAWRLATMA